MTRRVAPRRRSGFTLVEILLAAALLVVLLGGVYAGLETFRRVTTMGREQATEQQLARALRARFLVDLRSVRFAAPTAPPDDTPADDAAASGPLSESTAGASATAGSSATALEPQVVPVPEVGLVGDAASLTIYSALPPRFGQGGGAGAAARVSDLRTVRYSLGGTGLVGGGEPGLTRLEGDTAAVAAAEADGRVDDLAAAAEVIAPEVTGLAFRYHDGAGWAAAWDSSVSGSLPRAVEVTFQIDLDGDPAASPLARTPGDDRGPVTTRVLVSPPLSEPSAEATL